MCFEVHTLEWAIWMQTWFIYLLVFLALHNRTVLRVSQKYTLIPLYTLLYPFETRLFTIVAL